MGIKASQNPFPCTPVVPARFLGEFASLSALQTAHPLPQSGSYAVVNQSGDDLIYYWSDADQDYFTITGVIGGSVGTLQQVTDNGNTTTNPITVTDELGNLSVYAAGATLAKDENADIAGVLFPNIVGIQKISDPAKEIKFLFEDPLGSTLINVKNETGNPTMATREWTNSQIDAAVVGLLDDRGNYDASGNLFPSTGGSGISGAVKKGDLWTISVAGTLGGTAVSVGDVVRALVDSPGQTEGNWSVTENNLGYVPENTANKSNDTADASSTSKFPVWSAVVSYFSASRLRTILGISTLSGSNTGDETNASIITKISFTPENTANKSDSFTASSSTTFASTKALVDGLSLRALLSNTPRVILNNDTAVSTTGTETVVTTVRIDSLGTNWTIDLFAECLKSGTTSSASIKVYLNNTADLTGSPTQLAISTSDTNARLVIPLQRKLSYVGGVLKYLNSTLNAQNDLNNQSNAKSTTTIDLNTAQARYLVFTIQRGGTAGDTVTSTRVQATFNPSV